MQVTLLPEQSCRLLFDSVYMLRMNETNAFLRLETASDLAQETHCPMLLKRKELKWTATIRLS